MCVCERERERAFCDLETTDTTELPVASTLEPPTHGLLGMFITTSWSYIEVGKGYYGGHNMHASDFWSRQLTHISCPKHIQITLNWSGPCIGMLFDMWAIITIKLGVFCSIKWIAIDFCNSNFKLDLTPTCSQYQGNFAAWISHGRSTCSELQLTLQVIISSWAFSMSQSIAWAAHYWNITSFGSLYYTIWSNFPQC